MRILLTGSFGNIGAHTLEELLRRGHTVRCFDVPTRPNRRAARRTAHQRTAGLLEIMWGDLRDPVRVAEAVRDQDAVIHLAFVIPHLSATGVRSEDNPDWARAINVGGTANLIAALEALPHPAKLLFTSSLHIYGQTQHLPPPRTVSDLPSPIEHYALHKVECEAMLRDSRLGWAIYRLGAAMPVRLIMDRGMFDVPLDNRIEVVHPQDVALAIANGVEGDAIWGETWLIAGGERCQHRYRDVVVKVMDAAGLGMLPERAFTDVPYSIDWLDTAESQRVLNFQKRTLDDYVAELRKLLGWKRALIQIVRPLARWWLLAQSAYYRASRGRQTVGI